MNTYINKIPKFFILFMITLMKLINISKVQNKKVH